MKYQKEYNDYISTISTKGAAVSFETAALIFNITSELAKNPNNQIWVDTGSGFSSFLLRVVAKPFDHITVYSFDDHEGWLGKTIDYCKSLGVSTDNITLWNDRPDLEKKCSFVFHDLGDRNVRATNASEVLNMLEPRGTLIFDDLHKSDMKAKIDEAIKNAGLHYHDLEQIKSKTLDSFGRWAGLVLQSNA